MNKSPIKSKNFFHEREQINSFLISSPLPRKVKTLEEPNNQFTL